MVGMRDQYQSLDRRDDVRGASSGGGARAWLVRIVLVVGVLAALGYWTGAGMVVGKISVETPKYEVVMRGKGFEVREYVPQVAATVYRTELKARDDVSFMNAGFMLLAGYIGVWKKGQNMSPSSEQVSEQVAMTAPVVMDGGSPEQVAMTAPVVMDGSNQERSTMSFLLPAKYTMDTAPVPKDARVHVHELPSRTEAVLKFSGNAGNTEQVNRRVNELVSKLEAAGVDFDAGKWSFAAYNPPFTIPWFKTNEIHIPVQMETNM